MTRERNKGGVIVVGGGPAGLTAAIALAGGGLATTLVGRRPPADNRTTALLASSVDSLSRLAVWPLCAKDAAPLRRMRLVDDTGRLWRAPEVTFAASEIDLEAFGYNIENRHLVGALLNRAQDLPALRLIEDEVMDLMPGADAVDVVLKSGETLRAAAVIGADGARSRCRLAAGIDTDERAYEQIALTFCLGHMRPHDDCSTEFHTASGPFTLVPLPGLRSSLVWVVDAQRDADMSTLDAEALALTIERQAHSILGKFTVDANRGRFPLHLISARGLAGNRIALIGEAAHLMPPIGAQGLNLGLRDAVAISEALLDACARGDDPGSDAVLARYEDARRAETAGRMLAVDLLNRSLLSDFLPVQAARGLGLYLLDQVGPLRRAVMREGAALGVSASGGAPR